MSNQTLRIAIPNKDSLSQSASEILREADYSQRSDYKQSFTTPFVAASSAYARDQLAYASWGRGVESLVDQTRQMGAGINDASAFLLSLKNAASTPSG